MPSNDLIDHATSEHAEDFYELLGVELETNEGDIRKGYRKTALKYHPDKNQGSLKAVEKFHLVQIAYDVLSDPAAKAAYDNARAARRAKAERRSELDGKRRAFVEDLERRENELKRKREATDEAEQRQQRELQRLAEDGRRRRDEMAQRLRREKEELEGKRTERPTPKDSTGPQAETEAPSAGVGSSSDEGRCIKVRWVRERAGATIDAEKLRGLFSRFGEVDVARVLPKERKQTQGKWKGASIASGFIIFKSIEALQAAVERAPRLLESDADWNSFVSIARLGVPSLEASSTSEGAPVSTIPSAASSTNLHELAMNRLKFAERRKKEAQTPKEDDLEDRLDTQC